jgi:hypothetical protein
LALDLLDAWDLLDTRDLLGALGPAELSFFPEVVGVVD